jgi:hypothetical protein
MPPFGWRNPALSLRVLPHIMLPVPMAAAAVQGVPKAAARSTGTLPIRSATEHPVRAARAAVTIVRQVARIRRVDERP